MTEIEEAEVRHSGRSVTFTIDCDERPDQHQSRDLHRALAGPLARMAVLAVGDRRDTVGCRITGMVNTDEEVEIVSDRVFVSLTRTAMKIRGDVSVRVFGGEDAEQLWAAVMEKRASLARERNA